MGSRQQERARQAQSANARPDIFHLLNFRREKQLPAAVSGAVREVSQREIEDYLELQYYNAFRIALGVMLCINSPVVSILVDGLDMGGLVPRGAAELFEGMSMVILVAIAVCMYLYSAIRTGKWDFLREEKCHVDEKSRIFIQMERTLNKRTHFQLLLAGGILIAASWLPGPLFNRISPDFQFMNNLTMALFLVIVSIGVFLIVMTLYRLYTYHFLLKLNDRSPHTPVAYQFSDPGVHYSNQLIAKGMSVFWPTVICFYISMSFLTFAWEISWIIFPMAWLFSEFIGHVFHER